MEIEIRRPVRLDPRQETQLYFHSFLNLINVVIAGMVALQTSLDYPAFEKTLDDCYSFTRTLGGDCAIPEVLNGALRLRNQLAADLELLTALNPRLLDRADTREEVENLASIAHLLEVRHQELMARARLPFQTKDFSINELRGDFDRLLRAIEKNSLGRYRIATRIAHKQPGDYFIHIEFSSDNGSTLTMPMILKDVLGDLIANSRKYTEPGGTILAGVHQEGKNLRLVVHDDGRGIPEDELEKVVEFGFRARNVLPHETKGSGWGLTKAYWVVQKLAGRLWLNSSLGRGTRVTIELPLSTNR